MGFFTKKQDAIAIKEKYQKALDYSHKEVENKIHWLYKMNHKLKDNLALVQRYKKDSLADEEEKAGLYATLNNLLVKETNFEKEMLKTSQKGKKNTKVIVKPKIKDSDVDSFRINAVQEYMDKYPEYASKSSFKKILDKITEVEKGIKDTKKKYNQAISEVLRELSYWPRNIIEAEDLIKRFKKQMEEAELKLKENGFEKTLRFKFSSFKEKQKSTIHKLYYKIGEMENIIKKFQEEVTKAKRQDLEDMEY